MACSLCRGFIVTTCPGCSERPCSCRGEGCPDCRPDAYTPEEVDRLNTEHVQGELEDLHNEGYDIGKAGEQAPDTEDWEDHYAVAILGGWKAGLDARKVTMTTRTRNACNWASALSCNAFLLAMLWQLGAMSG